MQWKNLFSAVRSMSAAEAKQYIESHPSGDYQLVDVRQAKEYEAAHLPGAIFMPLATLPDRVHELAKDTLTIAYCAVGGRSRAASQYLAGQGFTDVYNMAGGIKAWQGIQAAGPEDRGMEHFLGNEEFEDAYALAYAMEDGLLQFYNTLAAENPPPDMKKLFQRLAGFEEKHKKRLQEEYTREHGENASLNDAAETRPESDIIEGGDRISRFLEAVRPRLNESRDILELAISLESQALDLYGRLAQKSAVNKTKQLFRRLADEEMTHLNYLVREFEERI
jgi:rhodanese-related sulfurtransferase/rubrerythrin